MANLNWGGPDAKTLYITASSGLYRIRLNIPGIPP
jgi:gluconolactonase